LLLYRNSLSALSCFHNIPNKWRDKKGQTGSSWHERGEDEEGERGVVGDKKELKFRVHCKIS